MLTDFRQSSAGFTLIEMMIALGLGAMTLLALNSATDFTMKSAQQSTMNTEHTKLRNLIQLSLLQRDLKNCPSDKKGSCCAVNLRAATGAPLAVPYYVPGTATAPGQNISWEKGVKLAMMMGPGTSIPFIKDDEYRKQERTRYELRLQGDYKRRIDDQGLNVYAGAVELRAMRSNFAGIETTEFATRIPLEFDLTDTGQLEGCTPRPEGRTLAGSRNSFDECVLQNGVPVATPGGAFCRFRTAFPPPVFDYTDCPDGWTGTLSTGCTPDTSADSALILTIPPCPPGSVQDDNGLKQGNLYCKTQGVPADMPSPSPAPECPTDPEYDPDSGSSRVGWDPYPDPDAGYVALTETRHCKYNQTCPPEGDPEPENWVLTKDPADHMTPACQYKVVACPQPMVQKSASPLICTLSFAAPPPPPPAVCPAGFTPLSADDPRAVGWVSPNHILCF